MTIIPTPERVTRTPDAWLVWVCVPGTVVWNHRCHRGACEPRNLRLIILETRS